MDVIVRGTLFVGALAMGREQAAIYAGGTGISELFQLALAAGYYALLVWVVWRLKARLTSIGLEHFKLSGAVIGYLKRLLVHDRPSRPERSQPSSLRLLPVLAGLSLVPNGFWLSVAILQRRGTGLRTAILLLAPCSAVAFKAYAALLALVKLVGLGWLLAVFSQVIAVVILAAGVVIVLDLAAIATRLSRRPRQLLRQSLRPLWGWAR